MGHLVIFSLKFGKMFETTNLEAHQHYCSNTVETVVFMTVLFDLWQSISSEQIFLIFLVTILSTEKKYHD